MKKINLAVLLSLLLIVGLLSGCGKKEEGIEGIKEEAENIEKKVEEVSAGVTVPGNLLSCPQKYFGTEITDCRTQPQEPVCVYYKIEKGGQERVDNGQFTSECGACKFYGKDGKIEAAGITLIGYEKGECYQGMYGKN